MSQRVQKLVDFFTKLPGIGPRQAMRLVLAMVEWPKHEIEEFSQVVGEIKNGAMFCTECFNLTDLPSTTFDSPKVGKEKCLICVSSRRDQTRIAVVEKITDLQAMEKTGAFNGVYHVLGGAVNPVNGKLPQYLKIAELKDRVQKLKKLTPDIEVIIATNPNTYGETTALYLEEELRPLEIKLTRLARGLASGGSLEYADEITLANALKHRR